MIPREPGIAVQRIPVASQPVEQALIRAGDISDVGIPLPLTITVKGALRSRRHSDELKHPIHRIYLIY
jgi:hypothetical protein